MGYGMFINEAVPGIWNMNATVNTIPTSLFTKVFQILPKFGGILLAAPSVSASDCNLVFEAKKFLSIFDVRTIASSFRLEASLRTTEFRLEPDDNETTPESSGTVVTFVFRSKYLKRSCTFWFGCRLIR